MDYCLPQTTIFHYCLHNAIMILFVPVLIINKKVDNAACYHSYRMKDDVDEERTISVWYRRLVVVVVKAAAAIIILQIPPQHPPKAAARMMVMMTQVAALLRLRRRQQQKQMRMLPLHLHHYPPCLKLK